MRCWMQARAERAGINQPESIRLCFDVSRNNPNASDANRARAEDPDGSRISPDGRGDGEPIDAQCACHVLWRDAVRHQCRDATIARAFGIDRAELDEPIERIVGGVAKVNSIRHASASQRRRGYSARSATSGSTDAARPAE